MTEPSEQTRARASVAIEPPVAVMGFRIPPNAENWRTRGIVAEVQVGDFRMGFFVRTKDKQLEVRPPTAGDGQEGVALPGRLTEAVTAAINFALSERQDLVAFMAGKGRRA